MLTENYLRAYRVAAWVTGVTTAEILLLAPITRIVRLRVARKVPVVYTARNGLGSSACNQMKFPSASGMPGTRWMTPFRWA